MRELTSNAQMPMPRFIVSPEPQSNALATGRNPHRAAVEVTADLLQVCSWNKVRGVLTHEPAQICKRDISIGSVVVAVGTAISFIAKMAISRSSEFEADRVARLRGSHV
jgi:heat shock protein HtpX